MEYAQSVLSSFERNDISRGPFPHLAKTGALPTDIYAELESTFPSLSTFLSNSARVEENAVVRIPSEHVTGNAAISSAWRSFFDFHTSPQQWCEIVRLFGDVIRTTHSGLEDQVGKKLEDFTVGARGSKGTDVNLECQFAINTPTSVSTSVKTAHVGKRQTVFAGLYYLRDKDDAAAGGDLELYRWNRAPRYLPHRMILPGDLEMVSQVPYAANSLVAFVNSPISVHGVSPRSPTPLVRRYVNLVAEVRQHLFKAPLISVPAALLHWKDIRKIRRTKVAFTYL
jgi:hypothetical protein